MDLKTKKDFLSIILGDPTGTGIDGRYYSESFLLDCLDKADIFHILAAKDIANGKYPMQDEIIKKLNEIHDELREVSHRFSII